MIKSECWGGGGEGIMEKYFFSIQTLTSSLALFWDLLVSQFLVLLLGFIDDLIWLFLWVHCISPVQNGCEMFIHLNIMQNV
jgi:hypothetical protein